MFLSDEVQKTLRSMQKIGQDEVLLKERDLFIVLNVITKHRRIIDIDKTLLETLTNTKKHEGRRVLKG